MRRPLPALALVFLATAVFGQGATVTMPTGFLSAHHAGSSGDPSPYSVFLGAYASGRMQILSGELTGQGARTFSSLSLRRDNEYYYPSTHGVARSWSGVTLQLGDSDLAAASSTFDKNFAATPTLVFSGSTSWAATTGVPASKQDWGQNGLAFPFASKFVWSARKDLCFDFGFRGGSLVGASSWTTANYVLLDGFSQQDVAGPLYNTLTVGNGCIPPGQGSPSFFGAQVLTYGANHPTRKNSFESRFFQTAGAKSTTHIGGIGAVGSETGIAINACERLHVLQLSASFQFQTDASGAWFSAPSYAPYSSFYAGLGLFAQAAYLHPASGAFRLTGAVRSTVPALPVSFGWKQVRVFSPGAGYATGYLDSTFVPILRLD